MFLLVNLFFYLDCIVFFVVVNCWDKREKKDKIKIFLSIGLLVFEMCIRNEFNFDKRYLKKN